VEIVYCILMISRYFVWWSIRRRSRGWDWYDDWRNEIVGEKCVRAYSRLLALKDKSRVALCYFNGFWLFNCVVVMNWSYPGFPRARSILEVKLDRRACRAFRMRQTRTNAQWIWWCYTFEKHNFKAPSEPSQSSADAQQDFVVAT
jgi:hypothetical protein